MKNVPAILFVAVLLMLCSDSEMKESDKYIPIEGIVFGMSLEEALELYPEPAVINIGGDGSKRLPPSEFYNRTAGQLIEGYSEIVLDDINVYGIDATAILLFTSDIVELNGEDYYYNLGLTNVKITFDNIADSEVKEGIYKNLSEGYDVEGTRLISKATIENMETDWRSSFEEFMSCLPFFNATKEQNHIIDRWRMFEKGIENYKNGYDSYSMQQYVYCATGNFGSNGNTIVLQGLMAALLYNHDNHKDIVNNLSSQAQ
jgi:hypothetical protein